MTKADLRQLEEALQQMEADGVEIHRCGDGGCSSYFMIHNARLHPRPYAVAMGFEVDNVCSVLRHMAGVDAPLTICSGGHHHEAMSSNTDGLVLLSNPSEDFDVTDDGDHLWVGAGQPLGGVIKKLARHGRLLPTGACKTVNVGGVTLGGGWGMSYRTFGLTVDALCEIEMVLPNGHKVRFDQSEVYEGALPLGITAKELFWATRGGGGGNFGVATRFKFELYRPGPVFTEFNLQWEYADRMSAATLWAELCGSVSKRLNTFARMTVRAQKDHDENDPAFIVGGRFYGEEDDCRAALEPLIGAVKPINERYTQILFRDPATFQRALFQSAAEAPAGRTGTAMAPRGYLMQLGAPGQEKDTETCSDFAQPHKVSSTLPKADADPAAVMKAAGDYIDCHGPIDRVNMYLSLHGMGGYGGSDERDPVAFPWRDRDYMLQIQAWWNPGDEEVNEKDVLSWVRGFREHLEASGYCEGAFINFPDCEQPVSQYYGESNYSLLQEYKKTVDPDKRLMFPMGIDPDA